jgi:predicted nucleic-acid-binding Zn-ribbon protein
LGQTPVLNEPQQVRCPKCGSTQIAAEKQGFSAGKAIIGRVIFGKKGYLAGFHGSKKMLINCLNCGNSWAPEDRHPSDKRKNASCGCLLLLGIIILFYIIGSR